MDTFHHAASIRTSLPIRLLLIDTAIEDRDTLIGGLEQGWHRATISANACPLEQLHQLLQLSGPVEELAIVAHGRAGSISLAGIDVDLDYIEQSLDRVAKLREYFSSDARISLYSCHLVADPRGQRLVQQLAELLEVSVYAASGPLGMVEPGLSDWQLNWPSRAPQLPPFKSAVLNTYPHRLETPVFGETRINLFTQDDQITPQITTLADGSFVAVWTSETQDGSGNGVFAQRFSADGQRISEEFRVNSRTVDAQGEPDIVGLDGGGFVIVWTDLSAGADAGTGNPGAIYAQRFDAQGDPVGDDILVNSQFNNRQEDPHVTSLSGGGFVVTWFDQNVSTTSEVKAQRFDSGGNPDGAEVTVNTNGVGVQSNPDITTLSDGSYVVVWSDSVNGVDLFMQRYSAAGVAQGGETQINVETAAAQTDAEVAALSGGGFVVVWRSDSQNGSADGSGSGVFARTFNNAGAPTSAEIQVNVEASGHQDLPAVAALSDGGFAVSWTSDNSGSSGDGSGDGVFVRRFDATGAPQTGEMQVNTETSSTQTNSAITALANGAYAVIYQSVTSGSAGDGDGTGIFMQLFGDAADFSTQLAPEVDGLITTINFNETDVNGAPQLLDSSGAAAVSDLDSPNFDGGVLILSLLSGYGSQDQQDYDDPAQDQLGVRDQGNGVGQIGVSGSAISYGGTQIGTIISDGQNGANLEISFNSNADAQALEAVVENLTYQNLLSDPVATRQYSLQLSDGDGGTSEPVVLTVNIVPDVDGAEPILGERQVNSFSDLWQSNSHGAGLNDGSYVIVWQSYNQDIPGSSNYGIFGQRYDANGNQLGPEFLVNTNVPSDQQDPYVAALGTGGFVVVWTDNSGLDGSGIGIFGQRFDGSGVPVGGEFQVNSAVTTSTQHEPSVVGFSDGSFMVVWSSWTGDGNRYGISGQRFDNTGAPDGGEIVINTQTLDDQQRPDIAALSDGGFVVVWDSDNNPPAGDGDSTGVFGQRFDAAGNPIAGGEFQINTETSSSQQDAVVAGLSGGGFVVAWTSGGAQDGNSDGVFAQRFDTAGNPVGDEFRVNNDTHWIQQDPAIVALDTGGFVISWTDHNGNDGSGQGIFGQQFDANGVRVDGQFQINTEFSSTQKESALLALQNGGFVSSWTSVTSGTAGDGSQEGVFQQVFGDPANFNIQAVPVVGDFATSVEFDEALVNAAPQLIDNSVALSDADSSDFDGGSLVLTRQTLPVTSDQYNAPDDSTQDQVGIRDQGTNPGQIGVSGNTISFGGVAFGTLIADGSNGSALQVDFNANASIEAVESLIENLTYQNLSDDPIPSRNYRLQINDGDGGTSMQELVTISITPELDGAQAILGEMQVNSTSDSWQSNSRGAGLSDGSYVIVWQSYNQDIPGSNNYGIFGQRYDANGNQLGPEFLINSTVVGNQTEADVAALAGGGFVVTWTDAGVEVFAQRFDGNGDPAGSEFQVNTEAASTQFQPSVVGFSDGSFMVVWSSFSSGGSGDGNRYGIIGQRYDNTGAPDGGEFVINTQTSHDQERPDIAALSDGGFVVVWDSVDSPPAGDGDGLGVFGQRFDASGNPIAGGEFQINTETTNSQFDPVVAGLSGGGFVVAWTSAGAQDGNSDGVFAQRFDAAGNPVDGEFRVSATTQSQQNDPAIVALDTGGFVIAWNDANGTDGSGWGVFGQQYDAVGKRVDGQFQINTEFSSTQDEPALLALQNGGFVGTWTSVTSATAGDGSQEGVFQQIFGDPANFNSQAAPVVGDLSDSVTFDEALVNAGPQLIDSSIALSDADSSDFNGGSLLLNRQILPISALQYNSPDDPTQDQVGIRNQGTNPGEIGVSGTAVSFGGVAFGTIVSDGTNGDPLQVDFTTNATLEAVESLIENLTYQNSSDDPRPTRDYRLQVSDGDGGTSTQQLISLSITPEVDGVEVVGDEVQVNTYTLSTQHLSNGAGLNDGSYVIVWQSYNQDVTNSFQYGIYGQRYDDQGNPIGAEFLVNSTTVGNQTDPYVASLGTGGFVVTWTDGVDIFAQRYDSNGATAGAEIPVNTTTASTQYQPSVVGFSDGSFMVVWSSFSNGGSNDGNRYGIVGQRYDNTGAAVGGEININTQTSNDQERPDIAALNDGGFVVVWDSANSPPAGDGSSNGVFGQRFDASGTPIAGGEFQINTETSNSQSDAVVAGLSGGGFVVAWTSAGSQDGNNDGVFAQRYDASGNPVDAEFRVNETTLSTQNDPAIVALDNGGFVIAWSDANGTDGSGWGVFGQQYDADGHRIDGPLQLNQESSSTQNQPALLALQNGAFVASWTSATSGSAGDGSSEGVFHRIVGDPADFSGPVAPILDEVATQKIFATADVLAGLQAIDDGVELLDPAMTGFNGGFIEVTYLSGGSADDQLGVINQGSGSGQIGVSGSSVSFEGANIGTIDGTLNGASGAVLRIDLNGSSTLTSTQSLIEALGYQTSNATPGGTARYIGIRVSDANGLESLQQPVQLQIQDSPAAPATLVLSDVDSPLGLQENVQQATPSFLDSSVDFDDNGSPGYNGGQLTLGYGSPTSTPTDELAINNQGNGVGQIGLSGSTVSFGGVQIGSVDGTNNGQGGVGLTINFSAGLDSVDSEAAIEALIENLTFQNTSDIPAVQRVVNLQVTDGSANSTLSVPITINITQDFEGPQKVFGEQQVNSFTQGGQDMPAVAGLSGGGYVVVWESDGQDGQQSGVFGQRYDAGGAMVGPEFQVNNTPQSQQLEPSVAALTGGGFVVTWSDNSGLTDTDGWGVVGQRYDGSGNPVGGEFLVNSVISSTQNLSSVAGLNDGGFVVAWTSNGPDGSGFGIFAQRYDSSGSTVGVEFQVNTETSSTQTRPSVSSLNDGGYVVIWDSETSGNAGDGSSRGVFGQRFDATGNAVPGGEFQVNTFTTSQQDTAVVAGLIGGGFVVAWQSYNGQDGSATGTYAQRFDAAGNPAGSEFLVNTTTVNSQYEPAITALSGGGFVISWTDNNSTDNSSEGVFGQEFDASGNTVGEQFQINSEVSGNQNQSALAALGNDAFVAAWRSDTSGSAGDGNSSGVFQQVFGDPADFNSQLTPVIGDFSAEVTLLESDVNSTPQLLDTSVSLTDPDSADFDGGQLSLTSIGTLDLLIGQYNVPDDSTQEQLGIRNQGTGAGQIGVSGSNVTFGGTLIGTISSDGTNGQGLTVDFNANATVEAVENLLENLTYANLSDDPVASRQLRLQVSDGDGATSEPHLITLNITPDPDAPQKIFGEQQTNSQTSASQDTPAVAVLNDSSYVIVWESDNQDGQSTGIFGQRFTAEGTMTGPEFQVNTIPQSTQNDPSVAALTGGGFVVTWSDNSNLNGDSSGIGISGQRYDASGNPLGSEFLVNTHTNSTQNLSSVTGINDGGFVVTWTSNGPDGSGFGIFAQRFDSSGATVAGEFQVNTETASTQSRPSVSALNDGGYVVVWDSETSGDAGDGSSRGIFGQRYDAAGNAIPGGEFQVNSFTLSTQDEPVVAGLSGGGFIVAWQSNGQDGSSYGIYAQRYDAAGNPVDDEFRVNETTNSWQYDPAITALNNGGFVISWTDSNPTDGSGEGVFGQVYDASGNRIDGEIQLNTQTSGAQNLSALAAKGSAGFVAAWTSDNSGAAGDGNLDGVFHQIFGDPADFSSQSNPVLADLDAEVSYGENQLNSAPQLLDANGTVAFSDSDSSDLDGGSLLVTRVTNPSPLINQLNSPDDLTQDQLGIRDQGTGAGQIGVSGSSVTFAGVQIGSLVSDGADGEALQVDFNSQATPEAVETLIENLTYQNISDDPQATRQFRVLIQDGDGGATVPQLVTVNITADQDAPEKIGTEKQTNSLPADDQDNPAATTLSDGSYVIVWESDEQDGQQSGIFGQRYAANGELIGPEFQVNSQALYQQTDPSIDALTGGGFVVTWTDNSNLGGDGSGTGVIGQRFDASANPQGGEFLVNTTTSSTQNFSSVAGLNDGGFVVTWASNGPDGSGVGIFGQRYDAAGATVAGEFQVNTETASTQTRPSVSGLTDGGYVVVWDSEFSGTAGDGSSRGIFGQRYDSSGNPIAGGEFQVNTFTSQTQDEPVVAGLSGGGFVVAWQSYNGQDGANYGIFAQRYDASGNPVDDEFRVNETTSNSQYDPAITALNNGGFVISWTDNSGSDGSSEGVFGQVYDAAGNRIDGEIQLNTQTSSAQNLSALTALGMDGFVAAWTSDNSAPAGDGNADGVFHQIFGDPNDFSSQAAPVIEAFNDEVVYSENLLNIAPRLLDMNGAVALSDSDSSDFDGGSVLVSRVANPLPLLNQINAPDNLAQDQLGVRDQGNGAGQIGVSGSNVSYAGTQIGSIVLNGTNGQSLEISLNANATVEAVEALLENLTYQTTSDDPLPSRSFRVQVDDGDGGTSVPHIVNLTIDPTPDGAVRVFAERQANTNTPGSQYQSDVSTLTDGTFVIVWTTDNNDIFGQRFDGVGNKMGGEFQVNTDSSTQQDLPTITATPDGGFVVMWASPRDGSGDGIFGQRYLGFEADDTPSPAGAEFGVNDSTSSTQNVPSVAMLSGGGFVATWESSASAAAGGDGNSTSVVARLFNADGSANGDDFVVNTEIVSTQHQPYVASLTDGGFIIVWASFSSGGSADGNHYGVFAQRYDSAGNPVGGETQINVETTAAQERPAVAGLSNGGYVIAWESNNQDGSNDGVFARQFDSSGSPVANEFRVNDQRIGQQLEIDITSLDTGGYVVSWTDQNGTDGSSSGVYAQQYSVDGHRIDNQIQVNTEFSGAQDESAISALPGGGFVVSWSSQSSGTAGDGSGDGVFYQLFGNQPPTITNLVANGFEDQPLTLDNQFFEDGFNDADGQALSSIRIDVLPSQGQLLLRGTPVIAGTEVDLLELAAGDLTYLGAQDFFGTDSFGWSGSDGLVFSASAQSDINIASVNDAPALEAGPDGNSVEGQSFIRGLTLTDPDPDTYSFTVDFGDGSPVQNFQTSNKTPNISHQYLNEGVYTVTVSVDDNSGQPNAQEMDSFDVTVTNADPIARNDFFSTDEITSIVAADVLADNGAGADSDPGSDPLSVLEVEGQSANVGSQITLASGALVTLASDGTLQYDPNGVHQSLGLGQTAIDQFQYTLSDGDGGTDTATVNVTVNGLNDNPTAQDDNFITDEDTPIVVGNLFADNGNGIDEDVDTGDTFTVTAVNGNNTVIGTQITLTSGALLTVNADGTFSYDPNGAFEALNDGETAPDSFTYTIEDDNGATSSATVNLTIDGVTDITINTPPVAQDDDFNTDEDNALIGADLLADNGNGIDDDADGDALTVTEVDGDNTAVNSTINLLSGALLTVNADGTFDYDPNGAFESLAVGQTAQETFSYRISDGNGGSDTATATIDIDGVNDGPVAQDDGVSTDEDTPLINGDLFADNGNGADSDIDTGDSFTVSRVNGQTGNVGTTILLAGGLLTVNANGTFNYDPNGAFDSLNLGDSVDVQFDYEIDDGNGGTDIATATITINGLNDDPIAENDNLNTDEDTSINNGDLFADNGNGADSEVDAGDSFTITSVNGQVADVGNQIALTAGGLLTVNADGTFSFDPNGDFEALNTGDSTLIQFDYEITDQNGGTDSATATITIDGVDEVSPPISIGNAPTRVSRRDPDAWENAWSDPGVEISHKADFTDATEAYTDLTYASRYSDLLSGGDVLGGDIGVSGRTIDSSNIRQEIDGTEALRFLLDEDAYELTVGLSQFFTDDDGNGNDEAGRVLLIDDAGQVVSEQYFKASSASGNHVETFSSVDGFREVVFNAGAEDLGFVFGGYQQSDGSFGSNPYVDTQGQQQGSEFLLDTIEFSFDPAQALGVAGSNNDDLI